MLKSPLLHHPDESLLRYSRAVRLRVASGSDRSDIIDVIDAVAGERIFLQTDHYCPTPTWEKLLSEGMSIADGLLLLAIENRERIVGFGRLCPDDEQRSGCRDGNVGIALLPSYRSLGIGAIILDVLMACAVELSYDVLTANILESNTRSKRLFSRRGFRAVGCRSIYLDFLKDHVNELYYRVELTRLREAKPYDQ